jgi:hypothetical protein
VYEALRKIVKLSELDIISSTRSTHCTAFAAFGLGFPELRALTIYCPYSYKWLAGEYSSPVHVRTAKAIEEAVLPVLGGQFKTKPWVYVCQGFTKQMRLAFKRN